MSDEDVFGGARPGEAEDERRAAEAAAERRAEEWIAATERLIGNADFREWLYALVEDFGMFDAPEAAQSEFRQGVCAAGCRICNRVTEADGAAEMFAGFARRHYEGLHKRLSDARARGKKERKGEQ